MMCKRVIIFVTLSNCFILCSVSFAQDTVFTIQSFKPENIRDGQILLYLSDSFYRSSGESGMIDPVMVDSEGGGYNHRIGFSPLWKLQFESPKSFFYSRVRSSVTYRNNKYESSRYSDDAIAEQPINSFQETTSEYHTKSGSILATLIGGRYIYKKFGVLSRSNFYFSNLTGDSYRKDAGADFDTDPPGDDYGRLSEKEYESKYDRIEKKVRIGLDLGPIYGRLYEGLYAAKAIEIVSELKSGGYLIEDPTSNQLRELAKIIYEEMNRYFYDSRIKRIETLDRIIEFLISENLMEDSPEAFLILSDIYEFSSAKIFSLIDRVRNYGDIYQPFYRPHGFQLGIMFTSDYDESYSQREGYTADIRYGTRFDSLWKVIDRDTTDRSQEYEKAQSSWGLASKGIQLFANYSRPVGWNWHLVTEGALNVSQSDTTDLYWLGEIDENHVDSDGFVTRRRVRREYIEYEQSVSFYVQIQYFLNSRTHFQINQKTFYRNLYLHSGGDSCIPPKLRLVNEIASYDVMYKELSESVNIGGVYYLTPRLSIRCDVSYRWRKKWDMKFISETDEPDGANDIRYKPEKSDWIDFYFSVRYYLF